LGSGTGGLAYVIFRGIDAGTSIAGTTCLGLTADKHADRVAERHHELHHDRREGALMFRNRAFLAFYATWH